MTTINQPASHSQLEADLGLQYEFAGEGIRRTLEDRKDLLSLGVIPLVGDFAGSGTDTLRITHMGGDGWQLEAAALASETDTITPSNLLTGYSEVALGMYGVGHQETYKAQILSREPMVMLDAVKGRIPGTWGATFRALVCTTGAAFSTAVGSTSTALSMDDYLDFIAAYRENPGSGRPSVILHTKQGTQLLESARNEPAFQDAATLQKQQAASDDMQTLPDFLGLGMDVALTNEVGQASSAYQGFGFARGGIGWAVASTASLKTANPNGTILIPQFGIVIEEKTDGSGQSIRGYEARIFIGVAAGSSSVFIQRRLISAV
jgi:hypothetical protein